MVIVLFFSSAVWSTGTGHLDWHSASRSEEQQPSALSAVLHAVAVADSDGDGRMDFEEFSRYVLREDSGGFLSAIFAAMEAQRATDLASEDIGNRDHKPAAPAAPTGLKTCITARGGRGILSESVAERVVSIAEKLRKPKPPKETADWRPAEKILENPRPLKGFGSPTGLHRGSLERQILGAPAGPASAGVAAGGPRGNSDLATCEMLMQVERSRIAVKCILKHPGAWRDWDAVMRELMCPR